MARIDQFDVNYFDRREALIARRERQLQELEDQMWHAPVDRMDDLSRRIKRLQGEVQSLRGSEQTLYPRF